MRTEYIIALVAVVILIILAVIIVLFLKKKGPKKIKIDEEFIEQLIAALGGIDNLSGVKVDNGRVKFAVNNLDLVLLDEAKKMSTAGIFITGNNIKMLFQYDADTIQRVINSKL